MPGLMPARLRPAFSAVAYAIIGAALLQAGAAHAQGKETSGDNKAAAKEHYTRGTSFYDLGRYDDAIKEFEAAYELKNDPAFLYNLAQSYRQAGNHEQALHFYKTYLRYLPAKAANRADIEEKIKIEEQAVAQKGTGITPPPNTGTTTPPPNTGTGSAGSTGTTTTPPPAGSDTVTVPPITPPPGGSPPPGYTPPSGYPPPGGAPPPAGAGGDPGQKFRIAGLATAGAGAVMMVVGVIEWRRAVSASNDIDTAAKAGNAFDPSVEKRGQSAQTAEIIFLGVGALAAAGGVGLWFYGQHLTASETQTWRVSLAPAVTPNLSGATLRIAF